MKATRSALTLILERGAHAVRRAGVDLEFGALDDLGDEGDIKRPF